MARSKTTLMIDRAKLDAIRGATGAASASEAVDIAMTQLLRAAHLQRDIEAYSGLAPTDDEIALAAPAADWSDLADDTDWEDLYGAEREHS